MPSRNPPSVCGVPRTCGLRAGLQAGEICRCRRGRLYPNLRGQALGFSLAEIRENPYPGDRSTGQPPQIRQVEEPVSSRIAVLVHQSAVQEIDLNEPQEIRARVQDGTAQSGAAPRLPSPNPTVDRGCRAEDAGPQGDLE